MISNKELWIGVVAFIVVVALGFWWFSASRSFDVLGLRQTLQERSTSTAPGTME